MDSGGGGVQEIYFTHFYLGRVLFSVTNIWEGVCSIDTLSSGMLDKFDN